MGKVVNFIKKYYFYFILGISILSFVAFFCPFLFSVDHYGDIDNISQLKTTIYIFDDFKSYSRFAWGAGIKLIGVIVPLIFCFIYLFIKKQYLLHYSLGASLIINGSLVINTLSSFIPLLSTSNFPHIGFFFFSLSFLISIFVGIVYATHPKTEVDLITKEKKKKKLDLSLGLPRFINNQRQWITLSVGIIGTLLSLLPLYRECRIYYNLDEEFLLKDYGFDYYLLGHSMAHITSNIAYLTIAFLVSGLIFAILDCIFKKNVLHVLSNTCFAIAFFSLIIIVLVCCASSPLQSYDRPIDHKYYYRDYGIPHIGFYLAIFLLLLSILSIIFIPIRKSGKILNVENIDSVKEKPLKTAERIEILELKLQVSELQKQIEELKKDG